MQNNSPAMDRAEVERIAYQAIGQQFRLPSLFSMLLLVVGFVLGHYVAARHTGEIADRFDQRITELSDKIAALESAPPSPVPTVQVAFNEVEPPAPPEAQISHEPFDSSQLEPPTFRLTGIGDGLDAANVAFPMFSSTALGVDPVAAAEGTKHDLEALRAAAREERDACMAELTPYVERHLSIPAKTVVQVIDAIYTQQDRRLDDAADDAESRATGITSRDTSVKIFPPMSEEGAAEAEDTEPAARAYRFFPKPSAPKSMFFSPVSNRVPAPATSAIDTDTVVR